MERTIIDYLLLRAMFNKELHDAILKYDRKYVNRFIKTETKDVESGINDYKMIEFSMCDLAEKLEEETEEVERTLYNNGKIFGF